MSDDSVASIISSSWEKVEARMSVEEAMTAFVTQGLDQCGATICLSAFKLVSKVLDEGGHVRRVHKSENQNLASILKNPEGPWVEQNKQIHRHWDFMNTWIPGIKKLGVEASDVKQKNTLRGNRGLKSTQDVENTDNLKYYILNDETVFEKFCEPVRDKARSGADNHAETSLSRTELTEFKNEEGTIQKESVEDETPSYHPICIETDGSYSLVNGPVNTNSGKGSTLIKRWETEARLNSTGDDLRDLEPYWMFDLHDHSKWEETQRAKYKFQTVDSMCSPQQKPDVVMEITYTIPKHSTQKKIVVIAEIDGSDKTRKTVDQRGFIQSNPAKLAVKAMQSTSVQAVLQEDTYHIRSNLYWYLKSKVDRSLLNTTNVEVPNIQEILKRYESTEEAHIGEFQKMTRVIHVLWHLYHAHVKIAFLIFMKEVHNIDVRDSLTEKTAKSREIKTEERMMDHHFFINFTNPHIPHQLKFIENTSDTPDNVSKWLKEYFMLQSRIKIKCCEEQTSSWVDAPIMQTSTQRSNMNNWSARVSSGEIPLFPKERATSVPIMYATIQRVNMEKLCAVITKAANAAFTQYAESRCKKARTGSTGVNIKRRCFPDRCYLTRREQLDINAIWNQYVEKDEIQLRKRMPKVADEKVELNLGYEKPNIIRDYKIPGDDMCKCKFDQIDVRMYYLHKEMEKNKEWNEHANGMWYIEDYVLFFQMLQRLVRPIIAPHVEDEGDFTTEPDLFKGSIGKMLNFKRSKESTQYRFQNKEIEKEKLKTAEQIDDHWISKADTEDSIETLTFNDIIEIFRLREQNPQKLEFANLLTELGVLIPFAEDQKTEYGKDIISFAKIQSFHRTMATVVYPYHSSPEKTYKETFKSIVDSYEIYATSAAIDMDLKIDKFFDVCLEAFKINNLVGIDGKTNIDIHLRYSRVEKTHLKMPEQNHGQDVAHHVFSVLSYFFDCRDDGACRYRWEESLLDYFGASLSGEDQRSDFHKFEFREDRDSDYKYYNEMWFQMCFFMEHNFRNAISAIHLKLFDHGSDSIEYFPDHDDKPGLQAFARRVFEREKCLFNSRSSFAGLGNVSPGLSFRKYDPRKNRNATLRHRILSQLDDELPDLDPALAEYVWKFRIPDSELFLRIIRCPNMLALRELAKQHLSNEPVKRMREVLDYFDPAIQSEIEVMLKFVQTDESVYVHTPTAHPSKRLVVTQPQLLKWMRQAVGCASFASNLGMLSNVSPLQCKYDLFLNHVSFHVLSSFFCTRIPLNSGTKRPLRFILLQLKMVDMLLRCENVEDCVYANDNLLLHGAGLSDKLELKTVNFAFREGAKTHEAPCVIGNSRRGWPKRDINKIMFKSSLHTPVKSEDDVQDDTEAIKISDSDQAWLDSLTIDSSRAEAKTYTEEEYEMTDDELRLWMLLAYARPYSTLNSEFNVSLTQENFMCKSGKQRDCEDIELHYSRDIQDSKPFLSCTIHASQEHMFFERFEKAGEETGLSEFPPYVKSMIPDHIDRMLIYVPKICADVLREKYNDTQKMFIHDVAGVRYKWRPVFAGIRTWCWKRLLVKMIFLHAVGKIMTGTKTLLTLDGNCDQDTYAEIVEKYLKPASKATGNTLGDLSYKLKWIPDDVTGKDTSAQKLMTVLSLYKYKERMLNGLPLTQITVCSRTRRQFKWLEYVDIHKEALHSQKSSRFMRLDKQQVDFRGIENNAVSFEASERFFSHRDYIYFLEEKKDLYVNLRGAIYVKFPTSFALRTVKTDGTKKETSVFETNADTLGEKMFCTMFDTRRYDWFKKIKVEAAEDLEIIEKMTNVRIVQTAKLWLPLLENSLENLQWAFASDVETRKKVQSLKPGYAFKKSFPVDIDGSAAGDYSLFTLPDFLLKKATVENIDNAKQASTVVSADSCKINQAKILEPKTWWILRGESGNLTIFDEKDANKMYNLKQAYEDETIAKIMENIDEILTSSASETMEH